MKMSADDEAKHQKLPNPIDRHVGGRVRMRRMLAGISQERLGESLGVTFQQIQKYEKGSNRISASRLLQIATMLNAPVSFFFEGASPNEIPPTNFTDIDSSVHITDFMMSSEGVELMRAFIRVKPGRVRRRIIDLVEALAEN